MSKIKDSMNFLKRIIIKNRVAVFSSILILFLGIVAVPRIFAQPRAIKNVEIFSEKLDYEKKEPGSWKIDKSAKWLSKGVAEINFDVNSVMKSSSKYTDVLFVLDISGSMDGDKLDRVKTDSIQLIESLLLNEKNRAGLITFDSDSEIVSDFTSDKSILINEINDLSTKGATNYYRALINVDNVLRNYVKEDNRECVVLFLTDGFPCVDTPNEVGQYDYLKSQYPFITINGVQYEMGATILDSIRIISDNQYIADMETLNNVLFDASVSTIAYDNFEITDYIDTNYFYVESEEAIKVNQGDVFFDKDNQKFTWKINKLRSGSKSKMTIKAKLKEELIGEGGFYPTNEKEEIKSKINEDIENVMSYKTPVLAEIYKVTYDGNAPDGCRVEGVPLEEQHTVFDTVAINDSVPKCDGYKFKGWKIVTKDAKKVNNDYFIMPEDDVSILATWSKLDMKKSMTGTVNKTMTLYEQVKSDVNYSSKFAKEYTGDKSTFKGNEKVYYYYGEAANNNVLFADYCWKIVRTTDTGGVKLLYNGVPSEDMKCNNSGKASSLTKEQINESTATILYNSTTSTFGDVGYMYNKESSLNYKWSSVNVFDTGSLTYPDTPLALGEYSVINNYEAIPYTFDESTSEWSSNNHEDSSLATIEFKVQENGNYRLNYSLSSANNDMVTFYVDDVQKAQISGVKSSKIELDNLTTANVIKVTYSKDDSGSYGKDGVVFNVGRKSDEPVDTRSLYGNSYVYENGIYTLKDAKKFDFPEQIQQLYNYHYTCFNTTGACDTLYYINDCSENNFEYVILNNGKGIDDILFEALYKDDVNKDDSTLKKVIDTWYENNMTKYTSYLEDTVWCNDRSAYDYGGFNSNGGEFGPLFFTSHAYDKDLWCLHKSDRFTVSSANGNGALKYPVGTITGQEIELAFSNSASPLASGELYWTMTPVYFNGLPFVYRVHSTGVTANSVLSRTLGVRPAVSLRDGIGYTDGNGSVDNPYVISLSS